jgi:UDP-N-acetylglucosamine acyltransferase
MHGDNLIHETSVIAEEAIIGSGNVIGPYSVIGPDVKIGNENWIGSHCVIGTPPEHRAFHHESLVPGTSAGVVIGDRNVIHEFVAIQVGTNDPTLIMNDCMVMAKANFGHDCILEDGVTIATGVLVGGHTHFGRNSTVGLGSTVHQGTYIGNFAMVGMSANITKDVPPFALVAGGTARQVGLNEIGIERNLLLGEWMKSYFDILNSDLEIDDSTHPYVVDAFLSWQSRSQKH